MLNYKKILNENCDERVLTQEELADLKNCLVAMYKEIYEACKKHGMRIYSSNGTTLGAVRHGGFIPWDDDLDLALLRKDYRRFGEVYEAELKDKYVISAPLKGYKAHNRFIQLYRKGTVLKTRLSTGYEPAMIYIDIFPVDYAPDSPILRAIKGSICNTLMAIGGCVSMTEYNSLALKSIMEKNRTGYLQYRLMLTLGKLFSWQNANQWFHILDKTVQGRRSGKCGILLGRVHYFGEIISSDSWIKYRRVKFEDTSILVPWGTDEYLSALYGKDYMTPPPVEKRESHHLMEIKVLDEVTCRGAEK